MKLVDERARPPYSSACRRNQADLSGAAPEAARDDAVRSQASIFGVSSRSKTPERLSETLMLAVDRWMKSKMRPNVAIMCGRVHVVSSSRPSLDQGG